MASKVLLTRPEGQNETLAGLLGEASVETTIVPMLEIAACPIDETRKQIAMNLDRFDHIVFVSRNAVVHGMELLEQYWPQWPAGLRWHAVGEATAGLLRARGLRPAVPEEHSTEGLLASGVFDSVSGAKILIVRGVGGRETLAQVLGERGGEVTYLEVYRRRQVALTDKARASLRALLPVVAVVYSAETLEALAANLGNVGSQLSLVVPSARVGDVARELGFTRVIVARGADENAILAAIGSAAD